MDMEFVSSDYDGGGNQENWPTCVIYATCGALQSVLQEEASISTPNVDDFVLIVRSHNLKNSSGQLIKDCGTTFPHLADQLNDLMRKGDLVFTVRFMGKLVDLKFHIKYSVSYTIGEFIEDLNDSVSSFRQGVVSASRLTMSGMHGNHCMQTWDIKDKAIMVNNSWGDSARHILVPGPEYGTFKYGCTITLSQVMLQSGPGEAWKKFPGWMLEGAVPKCVAVAPCGGHSALFGKNGFTITCGSMGLKEGSAFFKCWEDLDKFTDEGQELKSVSFAPDGGYVLLYGKNGFDITCGSKGWKEGSAFWKCWEGLDKYSDQGQELKSVSFAPDGGYVLLYGENGFDITCGSNGWKEGSAFWKCWEGLDKYSDQGHELKSVSFAPDGGYVLLYGKNGFDITCGSKGWEEGSAFWKCWEDLDNDSDKGHELKSVSFAPDGGYVLLHGKNGFHITCGSDGWSGGTPLLQIWNTLKRL